MDKMDIFFRNFFQFDFFYVFTSVLSHIFLEKLNAFKIKIFNPLFKQKKSDLKMNIVYEKNFKICFFISFYIYMTIIKLCHILFDKLNLNQKKKIFNFFFQPIKENFQSFSNPKKKNFLFL